MLHLQNNFISLFCFVFLVCSTCNANIFVDPLTGHFIDEFGRVRIFHGVNVVSKTPPYHPLINGPFDPIYSLNEQDVANLHQWGFNFVRLGMMWPGVEPYQGQYNQTYLNVMAQLISLFQMYNITVLLDAHQDLLSPKFCGEGVPDYAAITNSGVSPFPIPALQHAMPIDPHTGYPSITECLKHNFGIFYLADATGNAFQNFYNNVKGIQNSFGNFWQVVVRRYKSFPNVLGYEILNEPWPGDIYRDFTLLAPKVADRKNLVPLYNNIATKIRQIDRDRLIFFEQSLIDNLFFDITGFESVPGGPDFRNRSVFSYHIYCATVNRTGEPFNSILCDLQTEIFFSASRKEVHRLGCGGFMTEFGALDDSSNGVENINFLLDEADKHFQSWSYWQFKSFNDITTQVTGSSESFYNDDGTLQYPKVKALSRTYAYAIAGDPISMHFDPSSAYFVLTYKTSNNVQGTTEIYLNQEFWYPDGFQVSIVPPQVASWTQYEYNRIRIIHAPNIPSGQQITVIIKHNQKRDRE